MTMKTYNMSDVQTRLETLSDLQDLWSSGLRILTAGTYHSEQERLEAKALEVALELLEKHMMYGSNDTAYARTINGLPKAEEIKDDPQISSSGLAVNGDST